MFGTKFERWKPGAKLVDEALSLIHKNFARRRRAENVGPVSHTPLISLAHSFAFFPAFPATTERGFSLVAICVCFGISGREN